MRHVSRKTWQTKDGFVIKTKARFLSESSLLLQIPQVTLLVLSQWFHDGFLKQLSLY